MEGNKWPVTIVAAGATDRGRVRDHNEDSILVRDDLGLYLVADGAGGHNAGNVASTLTVASIANYFEATERASHEGAPFDAFGLRVGARRAACAVQKANRDVVEISKASQAHRGMGSTVVLISVDPFEPVIHVAHVGDSRCYRARGPHLELLTHDHSLLNDVLAMKPDMPDAALARLPRKVVTRALGMEESVHVSVRSFEVADGDAYLLCSDGLTGEIDDDDIREALVSDAEPAIVAAGLVSMANEAGGRDNIAAIVLRCARVDALRGEQAHRRAKHAHDLDESEGVSPEILLLRSGVASSTGLRSVPAETADQSLVDALGTLVTSSYPGAIPGVERACERCGATIASDETFCPQCGQRG